MSRRPDDARPAPPRGSVQIARFFGVPLYLSASWLLVALFITVAFADVFRRTVDGATGSTPYFLAAVYAVLSALCVLIHELGHVAVALSMGLRVKRVFIHILGGVTEIDPEPSTARQEIAVSAAGPIASAAIAGIAWLGYSLSPNASGLRIEFELLAWSNLAIAIFNALPGLPLDGGRVLRATVWGATRSRVKGTIVAAWGGRVIALGVAASGLLVTQSGWRIISVIFTAGLGAFLWFAAGQNIAAARTTARVPTLAVRELVRPAIYLRSDTPLTEALRQLWSTGARAMVVLDSAGRARAIVSESLVNQVAEPARAWTTLADVSVPIGSSPQLDVTLAGGALLAIVGSSPAADYLVVAEGRTVGVLSASDLRAALTQSPTPTPTPRAGP